MRQRRNVSQRASRYSFKLKQYLLPKLKNLFIFYLLEVHVQARECCGLWILTPSSNADSREFPIRKQCSCDFIKLNMVHGNQPRKFPLGYQSDHKETQYKHKRFLHGFSTTLKLLSFWPYPLLSFFLEVRSFIFSLALFIFTLQKHFYLGKKSIS